MDYLKNFEFYLHTDKNASHSTISSYITDIKNFLDFKETPKDLSQVTPAHIRSFISHLSNIGRKRSSINRVVCSLKAFFNYLRDVEKVISDSPTDPIKTAKKENTLPKHISESDVQSILRAATNIKDRLIVELLYGSGGRVSEVVSLKVEDIDFNNYFVSLFGKGNKERNNPIHENCIKLIKEYMNTYGIKEGYLFPHKGDSSRHMTREAVGKIVKRLAAKAGIEANKISPHVFRHSFAQHMLNNGCDLATIQDFLGHANIETTKIYARITTTNKRTWFDRFHPLSSGM